VSAPTPWGRPPLEGSDVDPAARRRRATVAVAVVAGSVVLAVIAFVAGRSGGDKTSLPPLGTATTSASTTTTAPATTTTMTATAGSATVPPIHVDVVVGMALIAGHIMCTHEDPLTGDTVADLEAAVAAENNGGAGPYAHDAAAQSEIVRASMQKLHATHRFYADCRPVTTSSPTGSGTTDTATSTGGSTSAETLPPSR
jgi:hypothetical protein